MNFDLSRHPNAPTDLSTAEVRAMASRGGAAARGAYGRAAAAAGPAAAKARAAGARVSAAAIARAREVGTNRYNDVKAFKQRWHTWLYKSPGKTNFWLLISNILYIAVSLTVLVLTLIIMHEHVDDFKRNEFTQHKNAQTGDVEQYPPCGMPTPDAMYLLQALGALPAAGWDGASLEPNYKKWMKTVDRALCARIIPGVTVPDHFADLNDCKAPGNVASYTANDALAADHVEELLALGYLMEDASITPTGEDYNDPTLMTAKNQLFEKRICLEDDDPDTGAEPLYSKQQRDAYGELKTRVARAYVAAMPSFSRYKKERDTCAVPDEFKDPFDSNCKHSCHLRVELESAANDHRLMWDTATTVPTTSFTKQLYRLLALSLAGYYDRYHNDGVCFRNTEVYDAGNVPAGAQVGDTFGPLAFCEGSMEMNAVGANLGVTGAEAFTAYSQQDTAFAEANQCGADFATYPPPSPAPPIYRHNDADSHPIAVLACASTLQYGLFEQGRLFGIPDVIMPFVLDNRVDRHLHFVGKLIYDYMYVKPMKKAGDILADPKSKLELYIAYRLSSTSIWAILVANVAGYMLVRAAAPMGVYILKFVGVTTNVKQKWAGRTAEYEPIKLVRPQLGWPLYLAQFVNLLVIYWIFFIDPATQSHYYVTPTCEDWRGLGVQVPSGAFGTTWGKRRYGRFGEHMIGILLVLTFLFVVFQQFIGKAMVNPELVKEAKTVKLGTTARLDYVALIMIGFALAIQILFVSQSIVSGDDWYQAIKASDNDAVMLNVFSKDVLMSVWAAFWTSASISWFRQKWAVDKLPNVYQYVWMASSLLLLWMPVFQSAALLADEIDAAFSDGKGTTDTPRLVIYILIYAFSAIWTAVLATRLKAMWDALPDYRTSASGATTSAKVESKKAEMKAVIQAADAAKAEQERMDMLNFLESAPASRFKFDLSSVDIGPAGVPVRPGRKTDAAYMPLLPAK